MLEFQKTKKLPYLPGQLFNLVLDIESYPEFLPWCNAAEIIKKSDKLIIADLTLNFKIFTTKYRSEVEFFQEDKSYIVKIRSAGGELSYLNHTWDFKPSSVGTSVSVYLELSLKSFILEKMLKSIFLNIVNKIIESFEQRASLIYTQVGFETFSS